MHKLTVAKIKNLTKRGLYGDGGGLYLQITKEGNKSWIFRYTVAGKQKNHGLGALHTINLAEARDTAHACRKLRFSGLDPIAEKRKRIASAKLDAANTITFKECAEQYIEAHKAAWKTSRHTAKWGRSLELYAYPSLGDAPVAQIDSDAVFRTIDPIWREKNETAYKVRGRIEQILDFAMARGYRKGDNPARLKGNLEYMLPSRDKVLNKQNMKSLPYRELPQFWTKLVEDDATAARMLRFTILTAGRTTEARLATHDEFDLEQAIWHIPGKRMKTGKAHRVPLSPQALAIVKEHIRLFGTELIFPCRQGGKAHSDNAMLTVLRRMGYKGKITVHGFRSTFKVWASEQTNYSNELSEIALAHKTSGEVEQSYKRTDYLDKRRPLMNDWATYCCSLEQ